MSPTTSKSVLCYYIKPDRRHELFETFTDTGESYAAAIDKLDNYFAPKKNVDFETFQFRQAVQQEEETVD